MEPHENANILDLMDSLNPNSMVDLEVCGGFL